MKQPHSQKPWVTYGCCCRGFPYAWAHWAQAQQQSHGMGIHSFARGKQAVVQSCWRTAQ